MKRSELLCGIALVITDFCATFFALLIAYKMRLNGWILDIPLFPDGTIMEWDTFVRVSIICASVYVLPATMSELYVFQHRRTLLSEIFRIVVISVVWMALIIAYFFGVREYFFSRLILGYALILAPLLVSVLRIGVRFFRSILSRWGVGRYRTLLVGMTDLTERLFRDLFADKQYKIVGTVTHDGKPRDEHHNDFPRIIGTYNDLDSLIQKKDIDMILITDPSLPTSRLIEIMNMCRQNQVEFHFVPACIDMYNTNPSISIIADTPVISLPLTAIDGWGKVTKRMIDIIGSAILITLPSPIMIVTAIGVKMTTRGSVIYKDYRYGKNRTKFVFWKFRSIHEDLSDGELGTAEGNKLLENLTQSAANKRTGPLHKIENDPRRTRFGMFIRRYSLDELPQLFHVFLGDMSLVGPRPHMSKEVEKYDKHHNAVFSAKPGVTGLAQVSGRSDLDFEREHTLDMYYINNWSVLLDISILLRTPWAVIRPRKAGD